MDLERLNRIYEDHWRLIYEAGQTPPIALLIRIRTLELLGEFPGPQAWIAYGYGIAEQVLETATGSVLALDDAQFQRLAKVLEYAATQGDRTATGTGARPDASDATAARPSVDAGTATWRDRVLALLGELRQIRERGAVPKDYAPDWLAVPIVYELLGKPAIPEFEGLQAVGIQWMRVELDHITPLSNVLKRDGADPDHGHRTPRVRGLLDDGTAVYLSEILERLEELVPGNGAWGAAPLDHLAAQVRLHPEIRMRGFSLGTAFLLQLLIARDSARPVPRSFVWTVPTAATGVLDGNRVVEVDHLEAKLAACERAGVRSVFVPGPQEAIARDFCARTGLSLEILGLHRSEDAGRVASRASSQLAEKRRSQRERLAQGWFWYLRSPVRAAAASVALLVFLATLVAVFWPVPTSCEWPENEALVFRNWLGLPVAHPKTGHWPGPEYVTGPWVGEFWEVLPGNGELLPTVAVMWGSAFGRVDILALLDWRGRVLETRSVEDDPALLPEDDGGLTMSRFLVRRTREGRQVLVVPFRTISDCLSFVRVYEKRGSRLERRGYVWHHGHLESFPQLDVNADGIPEQLALGWAQYLTADGRERDDLPRGERGRSVAYVIDLDVLADGPWAESPRSRIANLSQPGAVDLGLVAGWSFSLDPFTTLLSSQCQSVRPTGSADVRFTCDTNGETSSVDYRLRIDASFRSQVIQVEPNSNNWDDLRRRGWSADSIHAACAHLASEVTQRGEHWEPVPVAK